MHVHRLVLTGNPLGARAVRCLFRALRLATSAHR
jgi:hypothetical protein